MASAREAGIQIQRFLEDAGVQPGMKVLDVGCGAGDVSLLAEEIVGRTGSVVGIDLNKAIVDTALSRARERGKANVTFAVARVPEDLNGVATDFDAVVGRRVLCYIPSPAEALRCLMAHVRSGGIVAFQEVDWTVWSQNSFPRAPYWETVWGWISRAFEAGGTEMAMGTKLYQVFLDAGLPEPIMRADAAVGPAASSVHFPLSLLPSVRDTVLREGIAMPEEFDIEAIRQRLTREFAATRIVLTGGFEVRAWATKP
jgi:SAM-dependent methyltransferase